MNTITFNFHGQQFKWWQFERYTTAIIKAKSNDLYYHMSLTINDQINFEALALEGVVKGRELSTPPTYSITFFVENGEKFNAFYNKLLEIEGKKYDYKGVLLGFFGINIQNKNKWYCSELGWIFFKTFFPNFEKSIKTNISPKSLRMILEGLKLGIDCPQGKINV